MEQIYQLYSSLPEMEARKTWAEINLDALRNNYRVLAGTICGERSSPRLIAVVKAEAYGHGAPECVRTLLDEGCDFFAVSCIDEAVAVRRVCDISKKPADILILGYTTPSLASQLAQYNIIQTLLSETYAGELCQAARRAGVTVRAHVAVDTGMNRIGYAAHSNAEIRNTVASILRLQKNETAVEVEGLFTHFARADEDGEDAELATDLQLARYTEVKKRLEEAGLSGLFCHVCNSAAAILQPDDRMDGVRVGILLFGSRPTHRIDLPLRPVLKLNTVISHLHELLPGEAVSYGGTYRVTAKRTIATLPIGYADGFLRAYTGAFVTLHAASGNFRVPIVGRICMDQCMIDVTDTDAAPGDTVTFFGEEPEQLAAYAKRASTIDYECLCLISSRVTRLYVNEKKAEK